MTDRPLLLNGFMATGKTTLGRALSAATGHPFVDLDELIETATGATVAELFAREGEAQFRRIERERLLELVDTWSNQYGKPPVVALGGGALIARATRLHALDRAVVVTLEASTDEILRRARQQPERPLLGANPEDRIQALLEQRGATYAEAHARFSTNGKVPEELVEPVREVWQRAPIAVAAGEHSYSVEVGEQKLDGWLPWVLGKPSKLLLVTDGNVGPLHANTVRESLAKLGISPSDVVLDPGEENKRLASLERIWQALYDQQADRKSLVLALGGGVVSDIAGFAAATWMRGVRWLALPTTLLSMVDASVGGKTAVDFQSAKNSVGAFWQPSGVLCDVAWLETEPARGYTSGLAEVVKTALIGDPELFQSLERNAAAARNRSAAAVQDIVRRSIRVKARIVSQDERESGLRALLNLGHTLGHAFEATDNYTRFTHGEAVSLGLVAALRIGSALGHTPNHVATRTVRLLADLGLPTQIDAGLFSSAIPLLGRDKKRAHDSLRFIVAKDVGNVAMVDLPLAELRRVTASLA